MSDLKRAAHETIKGLCVDIAELTRGDNPMAWELASEKMLELKHVITRVLFEQEGEGSMSLLTAAQRAAKRLRVFRAVAIHAGDMDTRVDLAPAEFWEPEYQAVLDELETEIRIANGERPLMEIQ